jgi:GH18 family chitinase
MIFEKLKGKINKKKDFIVDKCIFLSLINYINLMTFDFYGKYIYVFLRSV